ncbi:MAG TPA: Ig-like domain-containing protein [Pseudonocardiaceae bacterium]|nr:Ig-like domain-containing protein [Pseudonocardiaceae bacterium]
MLGVALVGGLLAGCVTTADSAPPDRQHHVAAPPPAPVAQPAAVRFYPSAGAHGVNPADVITASVAHGTISRIALTNAAGKAVAGKLSPDHTTWTVAEPLGYGKTYTWSGSATGEDGKAAPISGRFSTLSPDRQISGRFNVSDGETYGVAIPIALTFSSPVTDKPAVEQALSVTTSKPATGLWAWLDDQTVHWRPSSYYTPGTHVTVAANLYGVAFAPGVYGRDDISASFTIGRSQVVQANTKTHRMVVITNGKKRADYPASFGLDSDPGRVTNSGTHVVMSRSQTVFMTNPKYHYFNLEVHWAVRISNNGEFIHAAPWSVGEQGRVNVSHGCVNLSTANAVAYYDSVLVGDPVEVTGSTQHLGSSDGDYYDWTYTWAQWQAKAEVSA